MKSRTLSRTSDTTASLIQQGCRSFIRVIVPYEISKVNFRVETKILVSMSEEI
jgi:hypothetical protein